MFKEFCYLRGTRNEECFHNPLILMRELTDIENAINRLYQEPYPKIDDKEREELHIELHLFYNQIRSLVLSNTVTANCYKNEQAESN